MFATRKVSPKRRALAVYYPASVADFNRTTDPTWTSAGAERKATADPSTPPLPLPLRLRSGSGSGSSLRMTSFVREQTVPADRKVRRRNSLQIAVDCCGTPEAVPFQNKAALNGWDPERRLFAAASSLTPSPAPLFPASPQPSLARARRTRPLKFCRLRDRRESPSAPDTHG